VNEVNALTTMGLDPVRFLVVTRIVAAVLMMPLLTLFADLIGILGGAITMITFNIPIASFLHEVDSLVDVKDLLAGLAKAPVFAVLIAGVGACAACRRRPGERRRHIRNACGRLEHRPVGYVVDGICAFVYYLLDIGLTLARRSDHHRHLTAGYEGNVLIRDINFSVHRGEVRSPSWRVGSGGQHAAPR
jgi:phospholipid/cholesterol/gamma-HCH transport system permease protein